MKKKTLSQALFNSIGKRIQSFRRLAEIKVDKKDKSFRIEKYCAIGAIGCENNFLKLIDKPDDLWGAKYALTGNDEKSILRNAGISAKTMGQDFRSHLSTEAIQAIAKKTPYTLKNILPLQSLIMALNDNCKWTFEKIVMEMQLLEENGFITYKSKK